MAQERWKEKMLNLLDRLGNDVCADCGTKEPPPHFLSYNIGVFVCIDCVGLHRSLGTKFSKTKSIILDNLDEHICIEMEMKGNEKARLTYEYSIPLCWVRPKPSSHVDIREQWIRAKYERKEFINGANKCEYADGAKYGWLWKKEKKGKQWNKRFFVLSSVTGLMCYYRKKEDPEPKQSIHIKDLNVSMVDEEMTKNKHSMLISFTTQEERPKYRHIFVYAENSFEIIDWFLTIRAARLNHLQPFLDGLDGETVNSVLSRQYIKMGRLWKTGSQNGDAWRKRFIFVDINRFLYFSEFLDPSPIKEIPIYAEELQAKYSSLVTEGTNGNHPTPPSSHCFMVHTRGRDKVRIFNFCAETRADMEDWIVAFREGMKEVSWLPRVSDVNKRMSILSNISSRSSVSYGSDFSRLSIYSNSSYN